MVGQIESGHVTIQKINARVYQDPHACPLRVAAAPRGGRCAYGLAKPDPWPLLDQARPKPTASNHQQAAVCSSVTQPGRVLRHGQGCVQCAGCAITALNHEANGGSHIGADQG